MIVGDAMGGKTSAYKVLSAGLADLQTSGLMEEYKVTWGGTSIVQPLVIFCIISVYAWTER